ncbi:Integral membrane protein TerC [Minicystis rosea]|nr:Integral membrane protein TerC [Minicystis rosea]
MPSIAFGPWLMAGLLVLVVALLAVDLGLLRRTPRSIGPREALVSAGAWVVLALVFAGVLWARVGAGPALDFVTGYVVEEALSVDNVFFILVTLVSFGVPEALWHRVLSLGILGAVVMRGALIFAGASLLRYVHAATYVLGAVLVITAIRLLLARDEAAPTPARHPVVRLVRRFLPVVDEHRGARFFVREGGRWHATPILLALVVVEVGDVVFAADSIPAVLAITTDPVVVFTSNILAVLGLRSLFFAIRGLVERFHYLKAGVSLVLVFIGAKMLLAPIWSISTMLSLAVIGAVLAGAMVASSVRSLRLAREGAAR